jgi:hypothetical protein
MPSTRNYIAFGLSLLALETCGTTQRFVDQPRLTIDESELDARRAAAALFDSSAPYTIRLCEANPASKECKQEDKGITASGVGGLFIPLTLHITGMIVSKQVQAVDGWAVDASFQSKADGMESHLVETAEDSVFQLAKATATHVMSTEEGRPCSQVRFCRIWQKRRSVDRIT